MSEDCPMGVGRRDSKSAMSDPEELARRLRRAYQNLPRGAPDLDQWRSVWMMLVGAWYLLERAEPFLVGPDRLDLDAAEAFARQLLDGTMPPESEWQGRFGAHPWISGFYVLSAEHRVANAIDRLTKVFAGANVSRIPDGDKTSPYPRCDYLASKCPHCHSGDYATHVPNGRNVLRVFGGARDVPWPDLSLARVYKRVNELKHRPEPNRSRDATSARSADAAQALRELGTVLGELAFHRGNCRSFAPLTT